MINTRRINAVPLFKRKVSSFLADGGHHVGQYGRGYQQTLREKYGILPSFDNYSGIECHGFIYFLSDISSSPVFRHRNRARAIPPVRSHWRGQCSIMHSINIKSRSFRLGSRNDALLLVMKAITICDKSDSYIKFMLKVFFLTLVNRYFFHTISFPRLRENEKRLVSFDYFALNIYFIERRLLR